MSDPLSEVIALLQPRAVFSKRISGAGRWGVALLGLRPPKLLRGAGGQLPSRGGRPTRPHARGWRLRAAAGDAGLHHVRLRAGDARAVRPEGGGRAWRARSATAGAAVAPTFGSSAAGSPSTRPTRRCSYRCCRRWCTCAAPTGSRSWSGSSARKPASGGQAATSCSRASSRSCSSRRCGRRRVTTRLRDCCAGWPMPQLAPAMRQMHGQLARPWTVAQLAKTAALSRSAFFERFTRTVGMPPMEYLLAWRMAVAKDLLRRQELRARRGRRTRRLWLGEHLQHRVQPARGPVSRSLRAGAPSAQLIQVESAGNR